MKRQNFLRLAALAMALTGMVNAITTENGKTFFAPQPIYSMVRSQSQNFEDYARRQGDTDHRAYFSMTPFYSKSQCGKNLRRLWMPAGKDELVIGGSEAVGDKDISGTWLKIMGQNDPAIILGLAATLDLVNTNLGLLYNNFSSKISVDPTYEYLGSNIQFYKDFSGHFFVSGECAVAQNRVTHNFSESNIQNQTTRAATPDLLLSPMLAANDEVRREPESSLYSLNATEAFTKPAWNFGKLSTTPLTTSGITDLSLKAGFNFAHGALYGRVVVPTGQIPTNNYMFAPVVGRGHFGLGVGAALNFEKELSFGDLRINNGGEYTYLFNNTQNRTFDLTANGVLSRYLIMRSFGSGESTPGVNVLTVPTSVTPNHSFGWHSGLQCKVNALVFGLDYGFHFSNEERLSIKNAFSDQFNIASEQIQPRQPINNQFFSTASISSPAGNAVNTAGIVALLGEDAADISSITAASLNLQSAQQPKKAVSQLGLSTGFEKMWHDKPVNCGVGYSYSFDHNNTALGNWMMWLQVSIKI